MGARRYITRSDRHEFLGRIIDLAMPLQMGFSDWEEVNEYPDALYVLMIAERVENLIKRMESLNLVGQMLWSRRIPRNFKNFPISRYDWLNTIADVFFMRLISVSDCACLLVSDIFQTKIDPRKCTIGALEKNGVPTTIVAALKAISSGHQSLKSERNQRFHHGWERCLSDDDQSFRLAATFEHRGRGLSGNDAHGRAINPRTLFNEGREELRKEFTPALRKLEENLDALYDSIFPVFETTFTALFRAGKPLPWEKNRRST